MISIINVQDILSVGQQMSGRALSAAWGILAITAPIAFAVALVRHSVGARHPIFVVFQIVAVSFALSYYGSITSIIDQIGQRAAAEVNKAGNFQALFDAYQQDFDKMFKSDQPTTAGADSAGLLSVVASFGAGLLSGVLSVLGALAVIVALHIYQVLQAVLYGVLVAVGPIVIAVAILPGAASIVGKWLSALFELAMWPVIGAVIFEMVGKALLKLHDAPTKNFVTLFVANIVLVCCVFLVPRIAARLVGPGLGAIGDAMQGKLLGAALAPFSSAGTALAEKGERLANAGVKHVAGAALGAMGAGRPYEPPGSSAPAVSLHVARERNGDFQRMFPDGEMKDGVFYSPDKVAELKRRGEW